MHHARASARETRDGDAVRVDAGGGAQHGEGEKILAQYRPRQRHVTKNRGLGQAVLVFPGGGFVALALVLEGEACSLGPGREIVPVDSTTTPRKHVVDQDGKARLDQPLGNGSAVVTTCTQRGCPCCDAVRAVGHLLLAVELQPVVPVEQEDSGQIGSGVPGGSQQPSLRLWSPPGELDAVHCTAGPRTSARDTGELDADLGAQAENPARTGAKGRPWTGGRLMCSHV